MIDILGWDRTWPWLLAALAGGYAAGSVPFGLLVARLSGLPDPRSRGSGNIGATNLLRTGGRGPAALTLLLDLAKGWLVVLLATSWGPLMASMAGIGAVAGHCFPVWLRFRGGKGVATAFGALLVWSAPAALGGILTWLLVLGVFRMVSVASLAGGAAAVAVLGARDDWDLVPGAIAVLLMILVRHSANLARLARGTEPRLQFTGKCCK